MKKPYVNSSLIVSSRKEEDKPLIYSSFYEFASIKTNPDKSVVIRAPLLNIDILGFNSVVLLYNYKYLMSIRDKRGFGVWGFWGFGVRVRFATVREAI